MGKLIIFVVFKSVSWIRNDLVRIQPSSQIVIVPNFIAETSSAFKDFMKS
jgi:hypothetical protein